MGVLRHLTVAPSAARLTNSLRDIGYDFPSAVADLVDNSIAAGAGRVEVRVEFAGADSRVLIADDGCGLGPAELAEALRFGSRRTYGARDLGRYGLGLKTASLSQCRTLTVVSRRPESSRTWVRQLSLDLIEEWDDWVICDPGSTPAVNLARELLVQGFNTVVVWEDLDRVLPVDRPDGGWARRRVESAAVKTARHLAMVFHRFLDGEGGGVRFALTVNGDAVAPWNPFGSSTAPSQQMPDLSFEVPVGGRVGSVRLSRWILPSRNHVDQEEWDRLAGPLKWNRQQGFYIYRADRLVQWGGWAGLRAIDEHTKLARVALSFDADLDPVFNINVAKMRVSLPAELRQMLERPVHEVCLAAEAAYRSGARSRGNLAVHVGEAAPVGSAAAGGRTVGLALRTAALQSGDYDALKRIVKVLADQLPEVVDNLGLSDL
jgi:hypothetical protein